LRISASVYWVRIETIGAARTVSFLVFFMVVISGWLRPPRLGRA
jgi:hypothetical protein